MSRRTKTASKPTRAAERSVLEAQWRESTLARAGKHRPLPSMEDMIEETLAPLRHAGVSDLMIDLHRIALVTQDDAFSRAATALAMKGLGSSDWRRQLKQALARLPDAYDEMRMADAIDRLAVTGSVRQAAEQTAAKFGGGASFESAAQIVRMLVTDRLKTDATKQADVPLTGDTIKADMLAHIEKLKADARASFERQIADLERLETEVRADW